MNIRKGILGRSKPRLLVDTTFLLPALGIDVEENALSAISLFHRFEINYLEVGLLEALWKVLKLVPEDRLSRVELGLRAIRRSYHLISPSSEALIRAIIIYRDGQGDYIDALHYTTARVEGIPFLTMDLGLIDFLRRRGYEVEGIVYTPDNVIKLLE